MILRLPQPAAAGCRFFLACLLLSLGACSSGPPLRHFPDPLPENVPLEIANVPFHPQEALQCGPAALATALGWSGAAVLPDTLTPYLFLPERGGTLQPEIKAQARRFGRIPYEIPPDPAALTQELAAGHPVLVLQNNGLGWWPYWHYAVVVGMDPDGEWVRLRSGAIERHDLGRKTFLRTWRRANYWALVILPPEKMPASVSPAGVLSAINDFARLGDAAAVTAALQNAVFRWPEDTGLRFALGNDFYANGERVPAEREYRRVLTLDPDAVMARNNLAWLLAERGDTEEAQALLAIPPEAVPERWRAALEHTRAFVHCRARGGACQDGTNDSAQR